MRRETSTVLIVLLFTSIFMSCVDSDQMEEHLKEEVLSSSWLEGWTYRRSHIINPSSGAGTGYQVRIIAHYSGGNDNDENIHLNNHSKTDFGDVRFTTSDGTTPLNYWMESKTDGGNATFWVKVNDDLSSTSQTIYIYYGNTDATTTSNGTDTFSIFDDFNNLDQWVVHAGTWGIENGTAKCTSYHGELKREFSHSDGAILYRARISRAANYWRAIVGYRSNIDLNQGYRSYWGYHSVLGGKVAVIDVEYWMAMVSAVEVWDVNTWYLAESRFAESFHEFEFNRDGIPINTMDSTRLSNSYVFIQINGGASPEYPMWFDWYAFRKYVAPEPTHGSWSSEFEQGIIRVPDNYPTIQEAINAANDGDTIFVRNGTYYENVVVNKSISLVGENRSTTTIDGSGTGTTVFVTVGPLYINGFTIQNGGSYGIYFSYTAGNTISDNIIMNNGYGIYVSISSGNAILNNVIIKNRDDGIHIAGSADIINNTITSNGDVGIHISASSAGSILNNTITNNRAGIWLTYSPGTVLRDNKLSRNLYNFGISGDVMFHFTNQDIDTSNTVDNKPIYWLVNQHNLTVDPFAFPAIGYLGLINSTSVIVRDLNLTNNGQGVLFAFTTESVIENVSISNCFNGILLAFSSNNTVVGSTFLNNFEGIRIWGLSNYNSFFDNDVSNSLYYPSYASSPKGYGFYHSGGDNNIIIGNSIANHSYGIYLYRSDNNMIYHNNLINNTNQVKLLESYNNTWDNGCEGNYWNNYNGTDLDGNGIGDEYLPWENVDDHPLMNVYWISADVNHDLKVDIFDVVSACQAYLSTPSDPHWNCHCDIAEPYGVIDIFDIVMICSSYGEEWN